LSPTLEDPANAGTVSSGTTKRASKAFFMTFSWGLFVRCLEYRPHRRMVPDSVLVNSIQTTGRPNANCDVWRDGERPKRGYGNGIDPDYRFTGAAVWRWRILWSQPRVLVIERKAEN
jgi:hypothetical protein